MIQEVKFRGLSVSPSDYDCQDGELATCLNLINEDGALKPIPKPQYIQGYIIGDCSVIKLVHKITNGNTVQTNYIIYNEDTRDWEWKDFEADTVMSHPIAFDSGFKANSVTSIGNVVCFVGDTETRYGFWNKSKNDYVIFQHDDFNYYMNLYFAEAVPDNFDTISVNMGSDFWNCFTYSPSSATNEGDRRIIDIPADKTATVFSAVDSCVNKSLARRGDEYLKYSTFAVIAVRLYDGSYYNISNIFPLNSETETLHDITIDADTKTLSSSFEVPIYTCSLKVSMPNVEAVTDFIQGIDVFVTRGETFFNTSTNIWNINFKNTSNRHGTFRFPVMTTAEAYEAFDNLTFYHSVFIPKDQFGQLVPIRRVNGTEEALPLANLYRQDFGGACAKSYNNRLHIANVSAAVPRLNSFLSNGEASDYEAVVKVRRKDGDIWWYGNFSELDRFLCIPVKDVVSVTVTRRYLNQEDEITLVPHSSLTMGFSYFLTKSDGYITTLVPWLSAANQGDWQDALNGYYSYRSNPNITTSPSLIRVSEAENPLVFPARNSVQVGSSSVQALAANTRPISEGQFGEAPLYAFTDEGVWTLMLATDGTYMARQPVSRDICSNPQGILQTDNAVLFPTTSGIMCQQGSSATCITSQLEGYPFSFLSMPYAYGVCTATNTNSDCTQTPQLDTFLKNADMAYDYYSSRIFLFNPDCRVALVYSLKSRMWGAVESNFAKRVDIYPEAYVLDNEGYFIDLHNAAPTASVRYLACTRPLALGTADAYKTVFTTIARGFFRNGSGKCASVLYGSNDLFNWHFVSSSVDRYLRGMAGSPYKYFRMVLAGSLAPDESVSGISFDIQERWQNILR